MPTDSLMGKYVGGRISTYNLIGQYLGYITYVLFEYYTNHTIYEYHTYQYLFLV